MTPITRKMTRLGLEASELSAILDGEKPLSEMDLALVPEKCTLCAIVRVCALIASDLAAGVIPAPVLQKSKSSGRVLAGAGGTSNNAAMIASATAAAAHAAKESASASRKTANATPAAGTTTASTASTTASTATSSALAATASSSATTADGKPRTSKTLRPAPLQPVSWPG
jgi:hypothetical protein